MKLCSSQLLAVFSLYVLCVLSGTEVRFVTGVGEEVDRGYLEPGTNLVSVVSTLSLFFSVSYHHSRNTGLIYHVHHRA